MAPDTIYVADNSHGSGNNDATMHEGESRIPQEINHNASATAKRTRRRSSVQGNGSTTDWWSKTNRYVSRRTSSKIRTNDLPMELDAIGFKSFWAYFWIFLFGVVPFCHVYIGLIVLHELCIAFDSFQQTLQTYFSWLDAIATGLHARSSRTMEVWCLLEALFYLLIKAKIAYLQTRDPLEASLSAAPLLDPEERRRLWDRVVECEKDDPISFLRGWFFDVPLEQISRYDVFDFVCWSLFDGRNPEHLTLEECQDLEDFVQELEWLISLQLYGAATTASTTIAEADSVAENDGGEVIDADGKDASNKENSTTAQPDNAHQQKMPSPMKVHHDVNVASPLRQRWHISAAPTGGSGPTTPGRKLSGSMPRFGQSDQVDFSSTNQSTLDNNNDANDDTMPRDQHDPVTTEDDPSEMSWSDEGSFGSWCQGKTHPRPKQIFRFSVDPNDIHHRNHRAANANEGDDEATEHSFARFSNMYDSFRHRYDQFQRMVEHADFHPIQDFVRFMEETALEVHRAEEAAFHRAQTMYTNLMRGNERKGDNAHAVPGKEGSQTERSGSDAAAEENESTSNTPRKQLWTSVSTQLKDTRMKLQERFETAKFWSTQRKALAEQLRGNRAMLSRMREMSYAVPAKQMAALMRSITDGHHALERTEHRAKEAFWSATSMLYNSPIGQTSTSMARNIVSTLQQSTGVGFQQEPKRYAKYSSDPLLGIATYPLGMHALVLGCTEIPLRVMLKNRGFQRRYVGPVSYYFHPGKARTDQSNNNAFKAGMNVPNSAFGKSPYFQPPGRPGDDKIPLVFVHGIGIGIIFYIPLIDRLLETGRPILLPEVPYVSGFRPWQGPNSVLSPAVVASSMTAMLAIHGFSKGAFLGHSYGTTWLSYMCKYAKTAVAALLFLDPICFCLHYSRLTMNFVYHRPDPGTSSFMVRTDIIVNWTIQRSFPWSWIILFVEQMEGIPCTIFLSDEDALVPAKKVESYLLEKGTPIRDFEAVDEKGSFFYESGKEGDLNACIFRGQYHGGWAEQPSLCVPIIGEACNALCEKVERKMSWKRME